ncbi:MAG: AMP-binding protein [Clostridia bacterium]|nr:AMP-binding protein [Clostridia bacterium]
MYKLKNLHKDYPLYETKHFNDIREMVENAAKDYPERVALSYRVTPKDEEAVRVTFPEARDRIRDLGTGMIDAGCRDAHVALIGEASYNWVCTYYGLMAVGAVVVPIDKELPPDDILGIMDKAECTHIFYSPVAEEKIAAIRDRLSYMKQFICFDEPTIPGASKLSDMVARGAELYAGGDNSYYETEIDPDRMATIVFTSGTTGKGKGVMLSQRNICSNMQEGMYNFHVEGKTMFVLPPHHTFGSTVNFVGHYALGVEVYISSGTRYLLNELKAEKPNHLVLVPLFVETLYKRIWQTAEKSGKADILKKAIKLSNGMRKVGVDLRKKLFKDVLSAFGGNLEMIICGGAALNQEMIDVFEAMGIVILNGYGITECSPLISCNRNQYRKTGSVGIPQHGSEVKIANPDENGEGEICYKGSNVMLGYYKEPEATAAVIDEDGFFHTGDWGKLDDEGWIYITGRLKNIIILANGKNVYPEEIEYEIRNVPGVSEVVVYAGESKNEKREIIVAEIFPDEEEIEKRGITDVKAYFAAEVKKINDRMPPYKTVGHIKIRKEEFVKNTSRKITRFNIDKSID